MKLYLCNFRNGNVHHKVVVQAENPETARQYAIAALAEEKFEDWKPNGTPEPITAAIFPNADATILREKEVAATV